jgi:hypothetical protein
MRAGQNDQDTGWRSLTPPMIHSPSNVHTATHPEKPFHSEQREACVICVVPEVLPLVPRAHGSPALDLVLGAVRVELSDCLHEDGRGGD